MSRQGRRVLAYAGLLAAVAATYTVAFKHGMAFFEGDELTYVESLQFVGQTFTTTGYGEYAPWTSNVMLITVVVMQLSGVFLIFLTLPLFVVPWIEERLEVEPPRSVDLEGHVVICGFGARDETLAAELDAQGVEYVVLTDDRETALSLYEDGWQAVHGDPETERGLERVNVADARTVVLDESDERNATIALTVGDLAPDVQTVCFVEDPSLAEYLRYAGADRVLGPREILGRSLARNVTTTVTSRLGDAVEIGDDFEIVEMPVQYGSDLDGATLGDTDLLEPGGVNAVGAWFAGEFVGSPDPDRELTRNSVLLVAGREDRPGVDVVGDATEGGTLRSAGIEDATALVLALGDDTSTVFATLVSREASERVEILCRANDTESARKLYAAGADYVLSLATVAGRMLAQTILDEDVMALDKQIDVVRTEAPALVGQTLAEADVRARTGCTVVAVQRGGEVVSQPDASFRIRDGDALVVVGADADVAQFNELAGVHATPP
ncbi:NAD-binding protein [Halobacterium sp. NMX12-1]|uniref:NAD-binding protein n=1 Tax=Halobacterium sp. NMX12-1 TaxID=3166650 RepID=A0AAU8C9F3_9EURY